MDDNFYHYVSLWRHICMGGALIGGLAVLYSLTLGKGEVPEKLFRFILGFLLFSLASAIALSY